METTTSRSRRFRPRDQTILQQFVIPPPNPVTNTTIDEQLLLGDGRDTGEFQRHVEESSTLSSVSSDDEEEYEDEDTELESMTAQGVQNLCSELLELKNESDEDFKVTIFSNYSVFLGIFEQMDGLENELIHLRSQAAMQKRVIEGLTETISLTDLSEEIMETALDESLRDPTLSPSSLEAHTDDVLEILDLLLSEHRLEEAISVLEMESRALESIRFGENFSQDELMAYNSAIAEKRAVLVNEFTEMAKNPRICAPELQNALTGLCKLGDSPQALSLLLDYYHSRIKMRRDSRGLTIRENAKHVFSMISQAARSFIGLHGDSASYAPELIQWSEEETGIFSAFFIKNVESLSSAVEAAQDSLSYCSLLEKQKIFLSSCLISHISPCIEKILLVQVDHYKKVITIFTSNDSWIIGRYLVSGVLRKGSFPDEYCLLTNSGRKFLTLFQDIMDDCSPLVSLEMEGILLRELMELFSEYVTVLESSLTGEESGIRPAESLIQGVSVIANLSTLMELFPYMTRSVFGSIDHLTFEIDSFLLFVHETHTKLRSDFLQKVANELFSSEPDKTCEFDDHGRPISPSLPYQAFYLELRKLQSFAEDSYIEEDWLEGLIKELMETIFEWISDKDGILAAIEDLSVEENNTSLKLFVLDLQFLEEIARNGGYMSNDMESRLTSAKNFSLDRYSEDWKWAMETAIEAIQKLNEDGDNESAIFETLNNLEVEEIDRESTDSSNMFQDEEDEASRDLPVSENAVHHSVLLEESLDEIRDESYLEGAASNSLQEMLIAENDLKDSVP